MTLDVGGSVPYNEYIFFHPSSRTLIITDAAFYFDENFPMLTQFKAKVLYGGYKILSPSNIQKIATKEKDRVRKSIETVLK